MSKQKINKRTEATATVKEPAYKKIDGEVTYVYNASNRVIDSYIDKYPNFRNKATKYKDLEVR